MICVKTFLKLFAFRVKDEVCDICGRAYAYKKSLAQHKQLKHSSLLTDDIFHSCGKCGKKYKGLVRIKLCASLKLFNTTSTRK